MLLPVALVTGVASLVAGLAAYTLGGLVADSTGGEDAPIALAEMFAVSSALLGTVACVTGALYATMRGVFGTVRPQERKVSHTHTCSALN